MQGEFSSDGNKYIENSESSESSVKDLQSEIELGFNRLSLSDLHSKEKTQPEKFENKPLSQTNSNDASFGVVLECSTAVEILELRNAAIQKVGSMIDVLSIDQSILALKHFKWKHNRVCEAYYEDSDVFMRQTCCNLLISATKPGLGSKNRTIENDDQLENFYKNSEAYYCCICFDKLATTSAYDAPCRHLMCNTCIQIYFCECIANRTRITAEANIQCPGERCTFVFAESFVKSVLCAVENAHLDDKNGNCALKDTNKEIIPKKESQKGKNEDESIETLNSTHHVSSMIMRYESLQTEQFVEAHAPRMKMCIGANCSNVIRVSKPSVSKAMPSYVLKEELLSENHNVLCNTLQSSIIMLPASCSCGCVFCFACGNESPHTPLPCALLQRWLAKCRDDSGTADWLISNTRACPRCRASIEKNSGCNHISCIKCKAEFCWVCLGTWSTHTDNYRCHAYQKAKAKNDELLRATSQQSLAFYLFYYDRYTNHAKAFEWQNTQLRKKISALFNDFMSISQPPLAWIECAVFVEAVDVLLEARCVLQNTYAFVYFLAADCMTEIFCENLKDLEVAVEALSHMLERDLTVQNAPEMRSKIVDKSVYVESRRCILLRDALGGLIEQRWRFSTNITEKEHKAFSQTSTGSSHMKRR